VKEYENSAVACVALAKNLVRAQSDKFIEKCDAEEC